MASKPDFISTINRLPNISTHDFREQIDRIKDSQRFSTSKQLQRFLDLLAVHLLSGSNAPLTQTDIAEELGLRQFDLTKPTVRIAAGRLRSFLGEFYRSEGKSDRIIVEFPKGAPKR